jgi:CheY-like chemotaxis protein
MQQKILVIDDDAVLTRLLAALVAERTNYKLIVENDATKAIATAGQHRPDLILLDVMMPEHDGGDVAAHIRKLPGMKKVPIIYMTAAVRKEEVDDGKGYIGGEAFVAKPFDFPYLLTRIREHLHTKDSATSA